MSLDEVVEMLIDKLPFLVFIPAHFFEVGEEVGFLFGLIQEAKLFIDERLYPDAADSLCLVQHIVVELPFHFVLRMGIDVDAEGLKAYFEANAKGLLEKGYKIEKVSGKKASFSIIPADGSYKVTFGEDEFIEFFKEFLRPQLVEMLF